MNKERDLQRTRDRQPRRAARRPRVQVASSIDTAARGTRDGAVNPLIIAN
jgi:hypothetical protein